MASKRRKTGRRHEELRRRRLVAGGSLVILVLSAAALTLALVLPSGPMVCREIKAAKSAGTSGHITGNYTWLEVNMCRQYDCTFKGDSCETACPFGYELGADDCPYSCECVTDTQGMFQGDLQIQADEMNSYLSEYGYFDRETEFEVFVISSVEASTKLWKDYQETSKYGELIYYDFEKKVANPLHKPVELIDNDTKNAFEDAILVMKSKTCLQFATPLPPIFSDSHILVVKGSGCWTGIGRRALANKLSLDVGCLSEGIILHQLYHKLGFKHEHARSDRDHYVKIHYDNMRKSDEYHFKKIEEGKAMDTGGSKYDLRSLVHLDGMSMSNNEEPTITRKSTGMAVVAQTETLSRKDWAELNYIYCQGKYSSTGEFEMHVEEEPEDLEGMEGSWGPWGLFLPCDKTCGTGWKSKRRECMVPDTCTEGSPFQTTICEGPPCTWTGDVTPMPWWQTTQEGADVVGASGNPPVDWTEWSEFGNCDKTCGRSWKYRQRECPVPNKCSGISFMHEACDVPACPEVGYPTFNSQDGVPTSTYPTLTQETSETPKVYSWDSDSPYVGGEFPDHRTSGRVPAGKGLTDSGGGGGFVDGEQQEPEDIEEGEKSSEQIPAQKRLFGDFLARGQRSGAKGSEHNARLNHFLGPIRDVNEG